ncbi:leucyl aminopeptidase [Paenibacillus sacheonensis]|uniref:Probable cytosol aminopeptidase n=1 Tax=Paenibacillus sacheonensis TaxID=742054 RepID=A0A7X4YU15_9BACL|nr:leucyl aminopeptidase [Paenibacillus sacheonensis]MBM7566867.1 leucyl aminopeptidase [Paenibacillus sacheonensis]NBC71489.1 leucyl aminopeptidase [Paenibacillus sacheonensis]
MSIQFTYGGRIDEKDAPDVVFAFVSKPELNGGVPNSAGTPKIDPWIHTVLDDAMRQHAAKELFKADPKETLVLPTLGLYPSAHVVYVGLPPQESLTTDGLRDAAAAAAKAAKRLKAVKVLQLLPVYLAFGTPTIAAKQAAQALTEGYTLGAYTRTTAKKVDTRRKSLIAQVEYAPSVTVPAAEAAAVAKEWEAGIRRGSIFAEAVMYARDLTNLPGSTLVPAKLAEEAERLAKSYGFACEIIDETAAAAQGMGGLIGVGKGSIHPPRMIVISYAGNPDDEEKWGIIGKGITFDTGGISLKKGPGMEEMISDMGGAAAVLGLVRIFGETKPKRNALFVIPTAENMPSDRAFKPGDVLTMMNGTTVEIVNTDAEGRLVLADGLTTAIRGGATKLIDIATLTGAVMVLLGDTATGSVTNDETLQQQVIAASKQAGERIWPLPPYPEFRRQLDSEAADMKNGGSRYGAASIAGMFIGAFAEERPWVHLDIAGTAWLERDRSWEVKGGTGVMVRTLGELLADDKA